MQLRFLRLLGQPCLRSWVLLASLAVIAIAGSGVITITSVNKVSPDTADYRFEPSSVDDGNWVTSWHDMGDPSAPNPRGFTSAWSSSSLKWLQPIELRTPQSLPTGDLYLARDSFRNRFIAVMIDLSTAPSVWYTYSVDSLGTSWHTPLIQALASNFSTGLAWDRPSVAVNGSGRIVIAASKIVNSGTAGYWSAASTDGGSTWLGPYVVVPSGGASSRVVASNSGYHAFVVDRSNPLSYVLNRHQSSDGVNWTLTSPPVSTYAPPLEKSPDRYSNSCPNPNQPCTTCSGNGCGALGYGSEPDAVASSTLGWVVAFPVNISGTNAINVSTELGGGVNINYTTDLFMHGITTSATGDWWLSYETYSGAPNRYLPLNQGVVYRQPGSPASYVGATIVSVSGTDPNSGIDPKSWFFYASNTPHCGNVPCFSAGDYMRPASNIYSAASIPVVLKSTTTKTALKQTFVQDPQGTTQVPPQFLPVIEPFVAGTDLTSLGVLTPAHLQEIANSGQPYVSSLFAIATRGH
jgi:hypothetical protein